MLTKKIVDVAKYSQASDRDEHTRADIISLIKKYKTKDPSVYS
ncbi:MAG: hypothetical protein ACOCQA_01125 [bacterium]